MARPKPEPRKPDIDRAKKIKDGGYSNNVLKKSEDAFLDPEAQREYRENH